MPAIEQWYTDGKVQYPRDWQIDSMAMTIACKLFPFIKEAYWKNHLRRFNYKISMLIDPPDFMKIKEDINTTLY